MEYKDWKNLENEIRLILLEIVRDEDADSWTDAATAILKYITEKYEINEKNLKG